MKSFEWGNNRKRYKSKIDAWLVILVFGLLFLSFAPIFVFAFSWLSFAIALLTVTMSAWFIFGTYYVVDDTRLYAYSGFIKFGPFNIGDITIISQTKSIESAPATSLDQIRIRFADKKSLIVSPKDKSGFISDLCRINGGILCEL